jgi:hypothetical protein
MYTEVTENGKGFAHGAQARKKIRISLFPPLRIRALCRIASFFSDGNGLFRIFGTFLELFLSRDEVATTGTLGNWECGVAITGYGKRGEGGT